MAREIIIQGTWNFFDKILVNNKAVYKLYEKKNDKLIYKFISEEVPSQIIFISPLDNGYLSNFFSHIITINGRKYIRRLNGFYTPLKATVEEIKIYFDEISKIYDRIVDITFNKKVFKSLLNTSIKQLKKENNKTIFLLDFGCGTGLGYNVVRNIKTSKIKYFGVDISHNMVRMCINKHIPNVKICTYDKIPFPDRYFDIVIANFVVHYFIDNSPFFEILRVLKDGGIFAFNLHKPEPGFREYFKNLFKNFQDVKFKKDKIKDSEGVKKPVFKIFVTKN